MKLKELLFLDNAKYLAGKRLPISTTVMRYSKKNANVPPHSHEFSELVVIAKGSIVHQHDGTEERLHAGDFLIIHSGCAHAYRNGTRDLRLYNVLYDPRIPVPTLVSAHLALLQEMYPCDDGTRRPAAILGRLSKAALRSTTEILDLMKRENAAQRKTNTPALAHLFAAAVAELSGAYVPPPDAPRSETALMRACTFVDAHLAEDCSVPRLARAAGVSERTLLRLFKGLFDTTPAAYVAAMRLARAETQLASTDRKLAAIAATCGFHDASHLSRAFKRRRGIAPGRARAEGLLAIQESFEGPSSSAVFAQGQRSKSSAT